VIEQLNKRGYGYGTGFLSPNCGQFIVSIPKNASSFILNWCGHHGWTNAVVGDACDWHRVQEVIVVLRDPLQRWISGMAQYITSYVLNVTGAYDLSTGPGVHDQLITGDEFVEFYNPVVERLLFDNLERHDDHVWPQIEFFQNILPSVRRKYFYINQCFNAEFGEYLGFQHIADLDANRGSDNPDTAKVQQFIQQRLNIRPELTARIIMAYHKDYQLINQVFQCQSS